MLDNHGSLFTRDMFRMMNVLHKVINHPEESMTQMFMIQTGVVVLGLQILPKLHNVTQMVKLVEGGHDILFTYR
jgi:hypothetical protein